MSMSSAFDGSMFDTHRRAVREGLARRELRDALVALVRRRVPREEVPDLVQSILCDALASERTPAEPEELARWVNGIARHKVADYRRRSGRLVLDDEAVQAATCATPAPYESRRILGEVLADPSTTRERETLDWMIREHSGEPLARIAEEAGVPSPTLRQRVSRLRRVLRSKFAWSLVALALVGSGAALHSGIRREPVAESVIGPEQSTALGGHYRVVSFVLPEAAPKGTRAWLEWLSKDATVRVDGARVSIVCPGTTLERTLRAVETQGDVTTAELVDSSGRVVHVVARASGSTLRVDLSDATMHGSLVLVR